MIGYTINSKVDFNSTRDTDGQGTYLASIIAGQGIPDANFFGLASGVAKGIAPHARLAIYKVAWYDSSSITDLIFTNSDIMSAMEQAIVDGVDIISISLPSEKPTIEYTKDPIVLASLKATQNGVLVVAGASDNGPDVGTVRNEAPWMLTVGASTIDRSFQAMIKLGDGVVVKGTSLYTNKFSTPNLTMVYGYNCQENSLIPKYVTGNILFCDDSSDVNVSTRVHVARTTGAVIAIVVYDDAVDLPSEIYTMSVVFVTRHQSYVVLNYYGLADAPVASLQFKITELGYTPAPMLATFSSVGPGPMFPEIMKPDLLGPGVNIMASRPNRHPRRRACIQIDSATSAAAAHVAGMAALL
ncbi:hypothetical protein SUGI_0423120 [Cryptomeria japonica]|uniref:subtilisin-like protease SBT1.6 n=1 Tax=Cryptomeria japonica TaxID=3369 RepID=UPI002408C51C|nr:subtilisin-like protease SBT1.6 [Cryptomeria japonica]GLJ22471.1 hypothetical protein SUGI_0423120 [Cryptomeria japonica]